jgi:hypothetical protein
VSEPTFMTAGPCPARGAAHQWGFVQQEAVLVADDSPDGLWRQGPPRLVFFCQWCLTIRRTDLGGRAVDQEVTSG